MCSNVAESFNNWIREACHLPITQLVDALRGQIMEQMSKCRMKSSKWAGQICPKMEKKLEAAYSSSRAWIVSQSDEDVYKVHSQPSVLVDMNGFPCSHAAVAIRNNGWNINDSIESYYHVSEFKASYSESIHPIPTVKKPTIMSNQYIIAPPAAKSSPGRPKRKRIPSRGEVVQRLRCSWCGKMGNHNRKACKEPI
ncbi:hypothetical protein ACSBR1_005400 [Camellia fascicularis]